MIKRVENNIELNLDSKSIVYFCYREFSNIHIRMENNTNTQRLYLLFKKFKVMRETIVRETM